MTQVSTTHSGRQSDVSAAPGPSLLVVATVRITVSHFLVPYAMHFRALGWRVDVAANGATGDPMLREAFDTAYELPLSRSVFDIRALERGQRSLQEILATAPDIVHVHSPIAGFMTRLAVRRLPPDRRPAVAYTAHGFHFYDGGHPATNAAFLTAERVAGRWTDRLVVINDEDEAAAIRHQIVPRRRLIRMPGIGLDTHAYAPSAVTPGEIARFRLRHEIPEDVPVFVIVGELRGRKRQQDAIAALSLMRHRACHLVLAGDGRELSALESQARELGMDSRVHFLGDVDDVRPVVCAATAVILPSTREGLARSLMEALSLAVPVIASSARGNQELVGTDAGLLFDIGDVSALATAMDWMIDHPDERKAMGLRGRSRMVEQYDLQVLLRRHENLYGDMLVERSRRSS